eukprot:CAMPEP_0185778952 /NCGR_PEP_ID=MMETSP1174-20130828/94165_1 /TAXON_ID=35687 /ORGANISM="Dictyocha speculum, Strain CCMP1381" /LENGTH=78 /DNA_ID=CAMNT_0028467879 /DNA_START=659 /DNA_END=895 /DNA_ORIENTATION=+
MGDLLEAKDNVELVEGADFGGEAAVDAQDDTVHEGGDVQMVKQVHAVPPRVCVAVLPDTLVVEPVNLRDLSRFMISSE